MSDMGERASLKQLLEQRDELVKSLGKYRWILRGTMVKQGNICGKQGCRCKDKHNPLLHGPYEYLSHRSRHKTQMVFLDKIKKRYAREGVGKYKQLIDTVYRISEINFKILRYHYKKMDKAKADGQG